MEKMLVCGVLGLVVACGGGQRPAPEPAKPVISNTTKADPPPAATPASAFEDGLVAMHKFRDEFCACKDGPCAEHVSDEMTNWAKDMSTKWGEGGPKLTEEQTKQLTQIGEEMGACMTKAMGGGSAPPPSGGGNPCGAPP